MKNQVLSVEQMKHLQELGIDTSKASCAYYAFYESEPNYYELRIRDSALEIDPQTILFIPTFTLQDILNMLPGSIMSDNIFYHFELLNLTSAYSIGYKGFVGENDDDPNMMEYHILLWNTNLLTSAYEMLCWLAENEHIGGKK